MGFFFNVLEMSINNTGLYITEKSENTFIYYLSDYVKKTCKTKKKEDETLIQILRLQVYHFVSS